MHTTHAQVFVDDEGSHVALPCCADRWLTLGAEYAVPEKLPLPREWYRDWDAIKAGTVTGLTEADIDEGAYFICPCAVKNLFWM